MRLRSILLRLLLPYRRTTETKAREALIRCGVSPDDIDWRVGADGSFTLGRNKHPEGEELTYQQMECLTDWVQRERIKFFIIGWERSPD
jgi:hypothetical protein